MTTTEQIELVEGWAWLVADVGLPDWDDQFHKPRDRMEYLYFGHLRWRYPHILPRWYNRALWSAWVYQGRTDENLVEYARDEVRKKFTRKKPDENPLQGSIVDDVVNNMPPLEPPFDNARRLTKTVLALQRDDWAPAAWYKQQNNPLLPGDLRDFRPDLTARQISKKITEAEEQIHE